MTRSKWLVDTEWLQAHLSAPDVVVVDGSFHLPSANRNARQEYLDAHIPGAVFFDIEQVSDTESDLPHMLPTAEKFASAMRKLGIGDGQKVIVYDTVGIYSGPRVWWMFRAMGCRDVCVLDGGFPKWKAEGRPIDDGQAVRPPRHFTARIDHTMVRGKEDILRNLSSKEEQIVDARSPGRFCGTDTEPRPGLRAGRIPESVNLPYQRLLTGTGELASNAVIEKAFADAGVTVGRPIVTSCGSGVTAAILSFGLSVIGRDGVAVYDGSWSEWGADDALPIESGA